MKLAITKSLLPITVIKSVNYPFSADPGIPFSKERWVSMKLNSTCRPTWRSLYDHEVLRELGIYYNITLSRLTMTND